jgi:hypothetical protein
VPGARATVFGLDVWAEAPVPFLLGTAAGATGRKLDMRSHLAGAAALGARDGFHCICDQLEPDGTVRFRVEAHAQEGYLLWGPAYGAHLLSADGRRLTCAAGNAGEQAWQRLLVAQVLPFAAVLNGLEVFHASAVVFEGQTVAFTGPSRAGKTSLALELCRLGAGFLADDVLAVESDGARLFAHAGTPVAGVDHAEARRMTANPATAEVLGANARELLVRMRAAPGPVPLAALFFLDRRADGPAQPRFEPAADAQMLLSATFNLVLTTPERLHGQLEVCALAAQLLVERIVCGPTTSVSQLGAVVEQRLKASL